MSKSKDQLSLFGVNSSSRAVDSLGRRDWPSHDSFPTNHRTARVRDVVWGDLVSSPQPLVVAGYASIAQLVELMAEWSDRGHDGTLRIVLGAEPFGTTRQTFRSERVQFTEEAKAYWLAKNISLRLSAKVLQAIELVDENKVKARFVHGTTRLHAKIFVSERAVTLGSSNFTANGLSDQIEANARFDVQSEKRRYRGAVQIAENFWEVGEEWNDELRTLLDSLLKVVTWQEALARACAELLNGTWAESYLNMPASAEFPLWPSQRSGIAEALWIMESVGSVLVADATGSGKTRMGAHLVRAARDRLLRTGRVRDGLTVLVAPPSVVKTWETEALGIGLMIVPVSSGLLSRTSVEGKGRAGTAVRHAQILAVDEAHGYLNAGSKRTGQVRDSLADNIMLFTATPISRGKADLLNLVGLLGPDNFAPETIEILMRLDSRRGIGNSLEPEEAATLRREIQRFTVRRTKTQINELVDRDANSYLDPLIGRINRYPHHETHEYLTGETPADVEVAERIRSVVDQLTGIATLERKIAVPRGFRHLYNDERWLSFRKQAIYGLSRHNVLDALRSSRAALVEHVEGTAEAIRRFSLDNRFKANETGNVLATLDRRIEEGPPEIKLTCEVPDWLTDPALWEIECRAERARYEAVARAVTDLSDARERTKRDLLVDRFSNFKLVLSFDRHPITLAVLERLLIEFGIDPAEVILATGKASQKKQVIERFALSGEGSAVALCSDAMNEGLNLQRAPCIVHLDLPTTLRVAEQRVGRVERMNSPHDTIESWWPHDGEAFATRAYEKLTRRAQESASLLGPNLILPDFSENPDLEQPVDIRQELTIAGTEEAATWDGIQDALDPVRQLVFSAEPLVDQATYAIYSNVRQRVMCRIAPVASTTPWAFFAVAAVAHGAPRWMLVDGRRCLTDLIEIADRLRELLAEDPPNRPLDRPAVSAMERALAIATVAERELLPRRMQRALEQMAEVTHAWGLAAQRRGDETGAQLWFDIEALASMSESSIDPYRIAESWLELIAPYFARYRESNRNARFILLKHVKPSLVHEPIPYEEVISAFADLPQAAPLDERVSACILGVAVSP